MNKLATLLIYCLFILMGCSPSTYPKANNIDRIEVKLDSSGSSNFGSLIPVNFIAHTERKGSVSINSIIEFQNSNIQFYPNSIRLHINIDPTQYADSTFRIVYKHPENPYWDSFELDISYDKNIYVNLNGPSEYKEHSKQTFLGSIINIGAGSDGENGKNGVNGKNAKVYIWKDSSTAIYSIFVKSEDSTYSRFFISSIPVPILIESNGGKGQDGEDGKKGRNGSSGNNNQMGGNGRDGGNGGNGGTGGNGGALSIYIHPNAIEFKDLLTASAKGGMPGIAGEAGSGGSGGNGNPSGKDGIDGMDGMKGYEGFSGPKPYIVIDSFPFTSILKM